MRKNGGGMLGFSVILLVLIFVLAGCGNGSGLAPIDRDFGLAQVGGENEAANNTNEASDEDIVILPRLGGTLNVAMPMVQTLNPLLNSDRNLAQVLRLIFEPLVIFDDEHNPIPNPAIVQSIIFAPSGQSLTITLEEGIFWEDGTAITADDIAFSIDILRHQAPQTAVYRANVAYVVSHNIANPQTININLSQPMYRMMYLLDFPIIPRHYYQGTSMSNLRAPRNMHPIGNGPFRFYNYTLATRLELIANDGAPGGRPYIDNINGVVLRDMADAYYAFERGIVDAMVVGEADFGRFRAMGKTRAVDMRAIEFDIIGFNHNRPIFYDLGVRMAIAGAMDGGARELFDYMGFTVGDEGILQRQVSPVLPPILLKMDIIVNEENPQSVAYAERLYKELTEAGVGASLYALALDDFLDRLDNGDFCLVVGTATDSTVSGINFLSSGNIFGYATSRLNALLSDIDRASNAANLSYATQQARRYVAENFPIIFLGERGRALFVSEGVHGALNVSGEDVFRGVSRWFITTQ